MERVSKRAIAGEESLNLCVRVLSQKRLQHIYILGEGQVS